MHIITTHQNADFDGLASMIAAQKLFPEALLVFPESKEQSFHEFISQNIKADYIFHSAESLDLSLVTKITVVDAQTAAQIGNIAECLDNLGIVVELFSHGKLKENRIATDRFECERLGACTSLFIEKFKSQDIHISPEEATIFALGIYNNTGSLTHADTQPKDIYAAGWLLERGANLTTIAQFLQGALGIAQEEIIREIRKQADIFTVRHRQVTIATITLPRHINDFPFIVQRYCELEGLDAIFVLVEAEQRIHLSAYSTVADVDAGAIAKDLGGTGTQKAGTAALSTLRMTEAEAELITLLQNHILPQASAREMMTCPAITISQEISLKTANETLTRYNVNALPVVDQTGLLGIISRQVVEKALHHDLGHLPISSYMSTEVATISPDAKLPEIQALIVEKRQRLLPVVDGKKVLGIISRTDLLNRLVSSPEQQIKGALPEKTEFLTQKRNIKELVHKRLEPSMVALLRKIGEVADKFEFPAFAVGGFVRDLLLYVPNKDLDIVVEGNGIAFAEKLAEAMEGKMLAHEKFMTAVVTLANGFKIDVATARLEYYESPASLPLVQLSSIKHDLSRRDFTINAMALQINLKNFGTLVDYYNSQVDLYRGRIRVLHNLSFVEDPSRIFRAIRFETRMNFQIGPHTERLIENAVNMNLFGKARDPRFLSELKIMFKEKDPLEPLARLAQFQFFQYLWPDLRPNYRVDRRFRHTLKATKMVLDEFQAFEPKNRLEKWMIYLLAIFHRSGLEELEAFCKRFNEEHKHTKKLLQLKNIGDALSEHLHKRPHIKPSELFLLLETTPVEALLYIVAISRQRFVRDGIFSFYTNLRFVKARLSGKDLMAMGYSAGPQFREILQTLQIARMDGITGSIEDEKELIANAFPLNDM